MSHKKRAAFFISLAALIMTALPVTAQVYTGSLAIFNQSDLQNFGDHYTSITGYLNIQYVSDLSPLQNFTQANGLYISYSYMTDLHGLESLVSAGVAFELEANSNLISLDGLGSLQTCDVFEILGSPNLQTFGGLNSLSTVNDVSIRDCPLLTAIAALPALHSVHMLQFWGCATLTDVSGLADLQVEDGIMFMGCPALQNCCDLYKPVHSADFYNFFNSGCSGEDILADGPCDATDLEIAFQFKDQAGNPVGDVLASLVIPGEKEWKQRSGYEWNHQGGEAWNARFKGWVACFSGPFRFKFTAPEGWGFVGPDSLVIERGACEDYYSYSGNEFELTRIDGSNAPSEPPVEAACPPENTAPFALAFLEGTPSWRNEGWCNAVDGDYQGWDGTATVLPDESGYPWAIFRFADEQTYLVKQVGMHVINFEDDEISERWATQFEVLVSTTGMNPEDFTLIGKFTMEEGPFLTWFNVAKPVDAKYVMLRILQPQWTSRNFKQVVEFCINEGAPFQQIMPPPFFPVSQQAGIAALPRETSLTGSYPNPFNPITSISYTLGDRGPVRMTVCNMAGQTITVLVDETQEAGSYQVQWNGADQPSGIYFCRFQAGGYNRTLRLVLVK